MNDNFLVPTPFIHGRNIWKGEKDFFIIGDSNVFSDSISSDVISDAKWVSSMQDPILRYLAIQSYNIFENTQNLKVFDLETILTKSKEYRAILHECEEQINIAIYNFEKSKLNDEEKFEFLTSQCNTIRDHQMIWHLAEIFFIKLSCSGYFVRDLQAWLSLQQPHINSEYNSLIDEYNKLNGELEIESSGKYWPTVIGLTIHGCRNELSNLLACHSHSNSLAFRSVRQAIRGMPVFNDNSDSFLFAWQQWQHGMKRELLDSDSLNAYANLKMVAEIILGDKSIFQHQDIINITEGCWFYAVVGYLLYSYPMADVAAVSREFAAFRRAYLAAMRQQNREDQIIDDCSDEQMLRVVDSIFNIDLGEFVCLMSKHSNDWWLCTHLIDLIQKINPHLFPKPNCSNQLNPSEIFSKRFIADQSMDLCEHFIINYASIFMSQPSLCLIGLNYLFYCGPTGAAMIKEFIGRMYMETDRFALSIHSWCCKRNFAEIAALICKRRSLHAFKQSEHNASHLGNSLAWALRGSDNALISRIADRLLKDQLLGLNGASTDCLIDSLRTSLNLGLVGKKMTFVVQFARVEQLVTTGDFEAAARAFINLLDAQLVSSHILLDVLKKMRHLRQRTGLLSAADIEKLLEILIDVDRNGLDRSLEVRELREVLVKELALASLRK